MRKTFERIPEKETRSSFRSISLRAGDERNTFNHYNVNTSSGKTIEIGLNEYNAKTWT
jgi:hypothetical protein